jgi:hypothetical protein
MTKKTAKAHHKKTLGSTRIPKPLFNFTWMLVLFLVLFIFIGIVIGINTAKRKSASTASSHTNIIEMGWQEYRDAAVSDVEKTLHQPIKDVKLVSFEKTDWPDSSLGCPKPGMMYTQVITPGYKLKLQIDGKEYSYHAGSNYVVLCNR